MDLSTLMGMQNLQQGGGMGALPQSNRTGLLLYGLGDIMRGGSGQNSIAMGGAMMDSQAERKKKAKEAAAKAQAASLTDSIFGGGGTPGFNPGAGGGQTARTGPPSMSGGNTPEGIAADTMVALGTQTQGNPNREAIASIESDGSGGYAAVGPQHPELGRALGRYQIMEANIGPWSKEVLGREVTPEQFLSTPQLQDKIFDAKFGEYEQQYGPEGAAQAWFSGPGGVGDMSRTDSLGTSNADYTRKFNQARGQQQQQGGGIQRAQLVQLLRSEAAPEVKKFALDEWRRQQDQGSDQLTGKERYMNVDGVLYDVSGQQPRAVTNAQADQDKGTSLRQNVEWIMSQNPGMSFDEALSSARGGVNVTTNVGQGETAFAKKTGEILANEASDVVAQGAQAQRSMAQLNVLEDALSRAPSGAQGALTNVAANMGIKTEGSSDVEVANAIISQLVPAQRPPGSGVMSDADLEMFRQSLPRLINTREGNKRIIDTMRGIADYDMKRGQIARDLQLGNISPQQASEAYQSLGNPLSEYRQNESAQSGGAQSFEDFSSNPSAQQAAEQYGVTLEEMWEIKKGRQ